MPPTLTSARAAALVTALCLGTALTSPAFAQDDPKLKAEIDAFAQQLKTVTHGVVTWEGSDSATLKTDNGTETATIVNPRLIVHLGDNTANLSFDRIEMRRTPDPDHKQTKMSVTFPSQSRLVADDGTELKLSLKNAVGTMTTEDPSGRVRDSAFTVDGGRLEHTQSGSWLTMGPLTVSSKTDPQPGGGWRAPSQAELKQIEFFVPDGPVGGTIDRLGYNAEATGPSLATLDKARDDLASLRQDSGSTPEERARDLLKMLPSLMSTFNSAGGEFSIDGIAVRVATGEPLFSVQKTTLSSKISGLTDETAGFRMTMRNEGLTLASSVLEEDKVPRKIVMDFGLENVATAPLRSMIEIASKLNPPLSDAEQQRVQQQLLGAAAMLSPVFRIYEFDLESKNAGIEGSAETKGSPLSPKGYTADADINVRGIDTVPALVGDASYATFLPLLKEMGNPGTGTDGAARLRYHLASAPQKWLTLNGTDITSWIGDSKPTPGQPRVLRPADPPMEGNDVKAVQRALAAAKVSAPQDGIYDGETAAAVVRYQKQNGLNPDGVVNPATREKLGVKAEVAPARPQPQAPAQPAKPQPPAQAPGKGQTVPNAASPPGWDQRK